MAKLGEVCKVSPSTKNIERQGAWLLNLDMVEQQTGQVVEYNFVGEDGLNGSITQFDTENVLYSKLRPNLNKVVLPERNGFCTSELLPLRPDARKLDRSYLAVFLRSDGFVNWAVSKTAGAKMPRLGTKDLLNANIPLPEIKEQKAIVEKFEKLEELIFLRKQQLAKLDELVKARFVEMFGVVHNSVLYPYVPVKSFTSVVSGGTPNRNVSEFWNNGSIRWVKTTELQNNVICNTDEKITQAGLDNSSAKIIPPNTVLIAMYGQGKTRGMTGYTSIECATNQACACILPCEQFNQNYLWRYMILSYDKLRDMAKGGNQPNLNIGIIKNFPVLKPPIELQNDFAAFAERVDQQKQTVQESLEKLDLMKKALMQEYFG